MAIVLRREHLVWIFGRDVMHCVSTNDPLELYLYDNQ